MDIIFHNIQHQTVMFMENFLSRPFSIIRSLFGKDHPEDSHLPLEPNTNNPNDFQEMVESGKSQKDAFDVGWETSVGKHRDHNQDAVFTFTSNLASNNIENSIGIYAVADGMGGHKHGDIASEVALQTAYVEFVNKNLDLLIGKISENSNEHIETSLRSSMLSAHKRVSKEVPGGGTTLTFAVVVNDQVVIAHIGDCRAYFVHPRDGITLLTRDHSLVSRMQELGKLTQEQAEFHPQRNVLYRALGQSEFTDPDIYSYQIPPSSYLLICSDGLWGLITENQISSIVSNSKTPQLACKNLVKAANDAGGTDNITVVLVRFPQT